MKSKQTGRIAVVLLLSSLIEINYACGPKKPDKNGGSDDPGKTPSAKDNMLGKDVKLSPDDSAGYDGKNGQAASPADLKCDFSGPCCWKNSKPPFDTMEWVKASGSPDSTKFEKNFGTSSTPSGNYLLTLSDKKAGPADKAEYQSCVIPCASDSIKVTVKHWASSPTKIKVCEVSQSDPNTLLGCQALPNQGPGPDTVTLPLGQNVYIAIIAEDLTASGGNMAIIQDINVDYPPCVSSPPTEAPTEPGTQPPVTSGAMDPAECKKISCDFESGTCGFQPTPGGAQTGWTSAGPDRFRNPATGVAKSPDNTRYAATYLKTSEKSQMESSANIFQEDRVIKFQEYKATEGMALRACCDTTEGCAYETGKKVDKGDFRQWYQGSVTCKKGTQKVIFVADNSGPNEGGVGIDNIQVFDASGATQIC